MTNEHQHHHHFITFRSSPAGTVTQDDILDITDSLAEDGRWSSTVSLATLSLRSPCVINITIIVIQTILAIIYSRYKALDRMDADRKLLLFQHLGFVHCPIRWLLRLSLSSSLSRLLNQFNSKYSTVHTMKDTSCVILCTKMRQFCLNIYQLIFGASQLRRIKNEWLTYQLFI